MNEFEDHFGYSPDFRVFAPARVNLIGEHIDYCGGDVLPMAIDQGTTIWGAANAHAPMRLYSARAGTTLSLDASDITTAAVGWERYVRGVLDLLIAGQLLDDSMIGGDYFVSQNIGSAGLSSSASFCAALAMAFGRFEAPSTSQRTDIARLCQRVEHEFAGVNCGIMDQMSVLMGHVIRLNCQALTFEQINLVLDDVVFVIMDTGAERTLAGSGYNERVKELGEIAEIKGLTGIESIARMDLSTTGLRETLARRLRHVRSEHLRVHESYQALRQEKWATFGELMNASHDSLKNDYEVSCEPLDKMVALAQSHPGVFGARMTGGGFGGCAVSLVRREAAGDMMNRVASDYQLATGLTPDLYLAQAGPGASFTRC